MTDHIYALISENLSGLGGPMGTEETWDNWTKYFKDPEKARLYAQKDYDKGNLFWIQHKNGWSTKDLGYVMYHIVEIEFDDDSEPPKKSRKRGSAAPKMA